MFLAFLIFEPNWRFWKNFSLCIVAIFANFQNGLISQILAGFWSRFLHKNKCNVPVESFIPCFLAFLIFEPNWPFCKGYSLCIVAIFANCQNGLIFRILALFWSRFLHNTTVMCFYSCFSHAFRNFNFWPKLTTLQRL